jgi:hypothetical protein
MLTKMMPSNGEVKDENRNQPKPDRLRQMLANMPTAIQSAIQNRMMVNIVIYSLEGCQVSTDFLLQRNPVVLGMTYLPLRASLSSQTGKRESRIRSHCSAV